MNWKLIHKWICLVSPLYCKRLPHISNTVIEDSLIYPSLFLANLLHWCWHHFKSPGNPPIWLSLKNYKRSELLTIQSNPKQHSAPHWGPCCLQRHCLVTLISKGQSTFHVKENICLIDVYHILLDVLTLGKLAVNLGYKILHCDLTIAGVLYYIGDMVVNNTHTCKPARDMLTQHEQWYWCTRYPLQFHSEHHHRNMPISIAQGVKHMLNCSIVHSVNVYLPTVEGLLCLTFEWSE